VERDLERVVDGELKGDEKAPKRTSTAQANQESPVVAKVGKRLQRRSALPALLQRVVSVASAGWDTTAATTPATDPERGVAAAADAVRTAWAVVLYGHFRT
jgi:hypothetical protein